MRWARRREAKQESKGVKNEHAPPPDIPQDAQEWLYTIREHARQTHRQANLNVVQARVRTNQWPGGFRRPKDQFVEEFDEEKDIKHR